VVGHGFQFNDVGVAFGAHFSDDFFEAGFDVAFDDFASPFRAPHNVVVAAVNHVLIGFEAIEDTHT